MSTDIQRAAQWMAGDDTGASSKAICAHMLGAVNVDPAAYPHDGDDLGRCLRLLALVPEWTPRIGEMAQRGPYWAALVPRWAELTALLAEETGPGFERYGRAPRTYKLMQEILKPVEDADPKLVRIGKGLSVRFT